MNTLEDRLRAALSARAEVVTQPMLTRSLPVTDPDAAPVLLLPPHQQHRSRRLVAVALAVAAVLLVAFGAVALHRATTDKTVGPAHVRPRSAIPWGQVGTGWMLQIAEPGAVDVPGGTPGWLYLIDPDGVLYRICKVPQNDVYRYPELAAWGAPFNTDHVILTSIIGNARTSLLEINLRSGALHAVTVLGHWSTAEFVDATDASILLNGVSKMVTVSADTGQVETTFEGSEFYSTLISADRTQVITGSMTTFSVLDVATGRVVRTLDLPNGYNHCFANSWLPGGTQFVARCERGGPSTATATFVFSFDGVKPPVRPAVPAGWDEVDLAGGKIAFKTDQPNFYPINGMSFARLSPTGQLEPTVVPAAFEDARWSLVFVTPAGLILENPSPDGNGIDEVVSWNPLTGQVKELFRRAGNGGPDGMWVGWRTTSP
ncbi:MAG TPA: hypothetical protein VFU36_13550 [Jatrophihabitans sp.]|nr:hypothetical protein [Jatrophihabitans sp.]